MDGYSLDRAKIDHRGRRLSHRYCVATDSKSDSFQVISKAFEANPLLRHSFAYVAPITFRVTVRHIITLSLDIQFSFCLAENWPDGRLTSIHGW